MRRIVTVMLFGVLAALGGCLMFYEGSEEGPMTVVAVRNEPGQPQESILQVGGRANWNVVVGPDGPRDTYFKSVRYYIASGGKTNSLSHATKWAYDDKEIEDAIPIRGTDRWMLAYAKITSGDTVTLDVRVFTAHKLIAQHEITEVLRDGRKDDLRGYGVCVISENGREIIIPKTDGDCVLDGVTGKLTRPKSSPDRAAVARSVEQPKGVSLYDVASDRILWTVADGCILSSRADTGVFITRTSEGNRHILRLRDETGAEMSRCEIVCDQAREIAASPNLKRVAYMVERNGGKLRDRFDDTRDAALRIMTIGGGSVQFDVGVGRRLEFRWVTDDVIVATWKKNPKDYDHYEYVVIDGQTGAWRVLPFDTDYYLGFAVDVAAGCAYLRGPQSGKAWIFYARQNKVTAEIDPADPARPLDPKGYSFAGIENGDGMVFDGLRHWVRIGWDGKVICSGNLNRKGIASVEHSVGHERLAVYLKGYVPAVLSLKDGMLIKGCRCMPSQDGKLLMGDSPIWDF